MPTKSTPRATKNRHVALAVAAGVVALVCGGVLVSQTLGGGAPDTKLAAVATQSSFVHQGNSLCVPLVRRLHQVRRFGAGQLLIVRTEVEEIAQIAVPPADRTNFNVLLGVLASYGDTYAGAVAQRTGRPAELAVYAGHANHLFVQLGLTSCSI